MREDEASPEKRFQGSSSRQGGWGIGLHFPIAERLALINGKVEAHEYLSVTLTFDQDLIDGAPAARFSQQLIDLIESGSGLGS